MPTMRKTICRAACVATTLLSLAWTGVALAMPAGLVLKSDDTNLMPAYILGGIGLVVIIGAIVMKVTSKRDDAPAPKEDSSPKREAAPKRMSAHAGTSSKGGGKHSAPGRHAR